MKKFILIFALALSCFTLCEAWALAAEDLNIKLPAPEKTGGMSLLEALNNRRSLSRNDVYDDKVLQDEEDLQKLSNLLWAAAGVNRDDGKLVFATALNVQDIILYAFLKQGVYKYIPANHSLELIEAGDHRKATAGRQAFAAKGAVCFMFVQDVSRWEKTNFNFKDNLQNIKSCGWEHVGSMTQSSYLYAASIGWGARTRMNFDKDEVKAILKLTDTQEPIIMQCVGPLVK